MRMEFRAALVLIACSVVTATTLRADSTPGGDTNPLRDRAQASSDDGATLEATLSAAPATTQLVDVPASAIASAPPDATQSPVPANSPGPQPPASVGDPPTAAEEALAAGAKPKINKAEIERLLGIAQQAPLEEPARAEVVKRLNAALEWLRSSEESRARIAQYEADIQQAPTLIEAAKVTLATTMPEPRVEAPPDASLQQLEQHLSQRELKLTEVKEKLEKREEETKRRTDRKAELVRLVDEARQRLEEARKQLAAAGSISEAAELAAARRAELEAREVSLESQLALFKIEVRRYEALLELLPLQRDVAKRDMNIVEREVAAWRKLVAARRATESARQVREARREAASAHPAVRELAERNAYLAEDRKTVAASIANVAKEADALSKWLTRLTKDFEDAQDKIRHAGSSTTVGLMLRKTRDGLPDLGASQTRLAFIQSEMPRANLQRMELEDERAALADLDHAVEQAIVDYQLGDDLDEFDFLRSRTHELLEKKRELLDQLANDYDTYLIELSQLEIANRKLMASTERLAGYIDEHVLWIRSCEPIGLADLGAAARGMSRFAAPQVWIETARKLWQGLLQAPLVAFALALAVGAWLTAGRQIRKRLVQLCSMKSGGASLRMWPTMEAVFWLGVRAAGWPLMAGLVGWVLVTTPDVPEVAQAVGNGLMSAALLLWVNELTRWLCKPGGVGEAHFEWSAHGRQRTRRHLRWLTLFGFPLATLMVAAETLDDGHWNDGVGRLSFIGITLLLALFAQVTLYSRQHVFREIMAKHPQGWIARTRFLFYPLAVGLPCALAVLAAVGYYYSARQLALRLEYSLDLLLGLVLASALASRWFLVRRRNMAIEHSRQRQAAQAEGVAGSSAVSIDPSHELPDLSAIHAQLKYLLCHAVVVCVFVFGWAIWDDVLPALKILDNNILWWNSIDIVQLHEDVDGNITRQKVPQQSPTTMRHLLIALLALSAAWVIARNLPALLEITILRRLPLDQGGRHAFAVILRYIVVLTGVIVACRTMNISWSSVQWLAAGMTVGLGFGLQEIFANFVSGLILLFERPIRVGDVITLGDVTGMVTNIRTRATTVRNWDRQELIVPNKELITGRLLNWTLSDSTNRIVITVGVAYKSDTREARKIMLEVARAHCNVLDDPTPMVTFEGFGDNSLTFVLRCCTATLDVRLETIHELHESINDRFRDSNIEIAFPQLDLHVRSADALTQPLPSPAERRAGAA